MTTGYASAGAYRQAIEVRLRAEAERSGRDLNWLRRRHACLRMLHRLVAADQDLWVLKGGLAVELRHPGLGRPTKSIDLAVRSAPAMDSDDPDAIGAPLRSALETDVDGDLFLFTVDAPARAAEDAYGRPSWRFRVTVTLAGRRFAEARVDVIVRPEELGGLTPVELAPGTAAPPAGPRRIVWTTDLRQQFAEKFHALTRSYATGRSGPVTDLLDLVLLLEDGVGLDAELVGAARRVFAARGTHPLPSQLGDPPLSWRIPYAAIAEEVGVHPIELSAANRLVADAWRSARG
ncbi:MAG: nucleotidyl transferase AbiEii/AbiGii toxin family protein [Actinomycetota bacterium]|nr:nucleotidyl transferase AbiEii/AbiGii toxin family protein [Actinomycetota bacterium]